MALTRRKVLKSGVAALAVRFRHDELGRLRGGELSGLADFLRRELGARCSVDLGWQIRCGDLHVDRARGIGREGPAWRCTQDRRLEVFRHER